jgi:hypothetical protein
MGGGRQRPDVGLRNFKHGATGHRFFETWRNMLDRCYDASCKDYVRYGARGIYVCDEWKLDVWAFWNWCDGINPAPGLTLDRSNNNGPYSPGNCAFTTKAKQSRNTIRTIFVDIEGRIHSANRCG